MSNTFLIYALIGISGVGKSHLTKYALEKCGNNLTKLIAVTTRKKRVGEHDGIDKYFFSNQQFKAERENLLLVRTMYGAYYGFKAEDLYLKGNLIVELYYKDYLEMKRKGYPVKGIYIWTLDNKRRKNFLKNRIIIG